MMDKASPEEFGSTVRNLRLSLGLSIRALASRTGLSPARLSRIEQGKEGPPRPEIVGELAKSLSAEPDALFRLAGFLDPDIAAYLSQDPRLLGLVRFLRLSKFSPGEIRELVKFAEGMRLPKPSGDKGP